jgi:hypothetical protein
VSADKGLAAMAAWNARRICGEKSRQYMEALDDLERALVGLEPRPPRTYKCGQCGSEGHNASTCENHG